MDLLIAFLKQAGALVSLAAGIIRLVSAASESANEDEERR